jgi:hypothetical protein
MNSGAATAFLPNFVGFPSLRGLHSSTVQPRRTPRRPERAPERLDTGVKVRQAGAGGPCRVQHARGPRNPTQARHSQGPRTPPLVPQAWRELCSGCHTRGVNLAPGAPHAGPWTPPQVPHAGMNPAPGATRGHEPRPRRDKRARGLRLRCTGGAWAPAPGATRGPRTPLRVPHAGREPRRHAQHAGAQIPAKVRIHAPAFPRPRMRFPLTELGCPVSAASPASASAAAGRPATTGRPAAAGGVPTTAGVPAVVSAAPGVPAATGVGSAPAADPPAVAARGGAASGHPRPRPPAHRTVEHDGHHTHQEHAHQDQQDDADDHGSPSFPYPPKRPPVGASPVA